MFESLINETGGLLLFAHAWNILTCTCQEAKVCWCRFII